MATGGDDRKAESPGRTPAAARAPGAGSVEPASPANPDDRRLEPALGGRSIEVLDALIEGCQLIGFDWRYLYLNPAAAEHGKRDRRSLLGRTMPDCYPGIDRTPLWAVLKDCMERRVRAQLENEFEFSDGSRGWFELRIEPVPEGLFILSLDASERRQADEARSRLEAKFLQAQKMEAIGRLAAGIAHDFNNVLGVIRAASETALSGDDASRARDLAEIRNAAASGAALARQLLTLGRQQPVSPEPLDLNQVVRNMESMLRRVLGEDVELVVRLAPALGATRVDRGQIEQALMNLAINARDAMPSGGRLTIETAEVELDEEYVHDHPSSSLGPHVMLAVHDDGEGMDEATRARLFEPFFTTKGPDRGTGLGLATVYGIVKQSRGNVWVYSEPGRGSSFRIYLPRDADSAPGEPEAEKPPEPARGDETVLVVEDQESMRRLTQRVLERFGYRVLAAADAAEALDLAESEPIHLVLVDVVLSGASGIELVRRLRARTPELRVLFMSGYSVESVAASETIDGASDFIGKPFGAAELVSKIRALLDG